MPSQWSTVSPLLSTSALHSTRSSPWREQVPIPTLGTLSYLPLELRLQIYAQLLVSRFPSITTFGSSSIISTSILRCSSTLHDEASPVLYDPPSTHGHVLENARSPAAPHASSPFATLPRAALLRMRRLTLRISFSTLNRGDCETEVLGIYYVRVFAEATAFALHASPALEHLRIELLNASQRKRGAKRVRSATVRAQIRGVLALFAACVGCREGVRVDVGGFDTLEYVDMWHVLVAEARRDEGAVQRLIGELARGAVEEQEDEEDMPPAYD